MKKFVAIILAALLVCTAASALAYSKDDPITITFWHTRGSGANYDVLKACVDGFNSTVGAEKGIIVEEVFQGGYPAITSAVQLACQAGEQPVVCVSSGVRISLLLDEDIPADVSALAEASGFDRTRFFDGLMETPGNEDGALRSFPYVRSTPVLYYNKTLADSLGLTAPKTVEELEAFAKAMFKKDESGEVLTWGFELTNDITFLQGTLLWSLGEPLVGENGTSPCLTGSSMERTLTDWLRWIDEGWCRPYDATNAGTICNEMLTAGKLGCFVASCASLTNLLKSTREAGIELGVSYFPYYNEPSCSIGGGNIFVVGKNNTDEQIAAGWEFVQYVLADEQVAAEAIGSGYLPTTKTIAENEAMKAFWEANPQYKVAYDQLAWGHCEEFPYWLDRTEFKTNCAGIVDNTILENKFTPAEAVQEMLKVNEHLL